MNKFIENDIYHLQEYMKSCKSCNSFKKKVTDLMESSYAFFMKRVITNAIISVVVILVLTKVI